MAFNQGLPAVKPFERGEDFDRWLKGLDCYFGACQITDSEQKKCVLLHLMGLDLQDIFHALPEVRDEVRNPANDAYQEACARLQKHFKPKTNKVYERYK